MIYEFVIVCLEISYLQIRCGASQFQTYLYHLIYSNINSRYFQVHICHSLPGP